MKLEMTGDNNPVIFFSGNTNLICSKQRDSMRLH